MKKCEFQKETILSKEKELMSVLPLSEHRRKMQLLPKPLRRSQLQT
jgi:hypothetical protein